MNNNELDPMMYVYALAILLVGAIETIEKFSLHDCNFLLDPQLRPIAKRIFNKYYWEKPFKNLEALKNSIKKYIINVLCDESDLTQYAILDFDWINHIEQYLNYNQEERTKLLVLIKSRLDDCRLMLDGEKPKIG